MLFVAMASGAPATPSSWDALSEADGARVSARCASRRRNGESR